MILIADSGSTKCTWLMTDGLRTERMQTRGMNAVQHTDIQLRETLAELPAPGDVQAVHFYGAGCGATFSEASARMTAILSRHFGTDNITVESDLVGAARALWPEGEGVACILGTGSNSCHVRNGGIVGSVPPLGYILGDEGGGAVLGRNLVNGIFKGHIDLRGEFLSAHSLTYEEIVRRVYREPFANRFLASFAPFIRGHMDCKEVRDMVINSFKEFAARNLHAYPAGLPVSFVGGIAAHFEELLREAVAACGRTVATIVESPAEGVLKYHYGK